MLEDFAVSFRLRNTYKTNGIIYSLKSLPLIKRLLPPALYASRGLKAFANVISGIIEFFAMFSGKALYLLILWLQAMAMQAQRADSFAHMLIILTLVGGFMNTHIFEPTRDVFYAIFIMRMNAKRYTLTNYAYFLLKMFVGFLAFAFLFGLLCGESVVFCLCVPLYVICVKLCFTAISLADFSHNGRTWNENKLTPFMWIGCVVLLAAAVIPPYIGFALDRRILPALTIALIIPAVFALRYIIRFDSYRPIYKDLLRPENFIVTDSKSAAGAAQQLAMQKKMSADISQTSNKSGYKFFNELFMKRHSRLLTKSAKRITIVCAVFFAAAAAGVYIFPDARPVVNGILMTYLPYFLFIMYLINRGKVITQAMFMNCDHSMLAYRFYRQPKALLSLFLDRLKYIILINLAPAFVIGTGLAVLLWLTGGTSQVMNYAVLFVSIIAMSVFFSVHNIVLYYLLQPYNVNLESKSATYGVVNWITYMVCYAGIQVKLPTLIFGSVISAFCIIYAVVAFILAYRLAPKTFKLRP